jgi:ribosomal protein S1
VPQHLRAPPDGSQRARPAWSRHELVARTTPGAVVASGDQITVTVLRVDEGTGKAFPIGSEVEVAVLEADASGRRIRLSKKAVAQQREQAELREYAARPDAAPATPLGSLADKLRDALKSR